MLTIRKKHFGKTNVQIKTKSGIVLQMERPEGYWSRGSIQMSPQEPRVTPEIGVKAVNFLVDIGASQCPNKDKSRVQYSRRRDLRTTEVGDPFR